MTFPALRTATHVPCTGETVDSLGNAMPVFGTPVDVPAMAWAPHNTETWPATTSPLIETANVDLYLPKTSLAAVDLKDQFTLSGDLFEVVGVQDWTEGLIDLPAGLCVALRKVEG